jgi:hypothetical protein
MLHREMAAEWFKLADQAAREGAAPRSSTKALSHQLDAQIETLAGPGGTTVSITHATFPAKVAA